ncbi:MAG: DUF2877 domain-containing protein, partial [Anaerolineae bacterium]
LWAGWEKKHLEGDTDVESTSVPAFAFRANLPAEIYRASVPCTNRISRAFLSAAWKGRVDTRWHRLLKALAAGRRTEIARAARAVLEFGSTSGLDMVSGFLWIQDLAEIHDFSKLGEL